MTRREAKRSAVDPKDTAYSTRPLASALKFYAANDVNFMPAVYDRSSGLIGSDSGRWTKIASASKPMVKESASGDLQAEGIMVKISFVHILGAQGENKID